MSEEKSEQVEALYPLWRYHLWHVGYGSYNDIEEAIAKGELEPFTCVKVDCDCNWPKRDRNTPVSQPPVAEAPERITAGPCSQCGAMVVGLNACPHCGTDWIGTRYQYTRATSPADIREKAERAAALLGDAGLLRLARKDGDEPTFKRVADIIVAEFTGAENKS